MPHDWKQQKNLIMIDCTCSKGEKGAVYSPVMFKPPLRSSGRRFILQGSVFVSQRCRPGVLSCGTHSSQQPAAILQVPTSGHLSTRTYTRARRERERERERVWGGWEGVHTHSSTFSKILHFQLTCYVSIRAATQMHNLIMYKIQNVDSC